jgi:hypothetical protein
MAAVFVDLLADDDDAALQVNVVRENPELVSVA